MTADTNGSDRATQTYRRLRQLIVQGRIAPGARVIETDLADRLGVSRTPVRAALQRLEQEGYIETDQSSRRWRPSVAPLTVEDSDELFHIIGQLEGLAARRAARLQDPEHTALVSRLRELNEALKETSESGEGLPTDCFDTDMAFHWSYIEAAAGPRLRNLLAGIKPQAERYIRVYVNAFLDKLETSTSEHDRIVRAIESRDPDAAERAVRRNWEGTAERTAHLIERIGERGSW